ncbi:kinase-like domain-containing protein [Cokeromyces recurvatus]|uniref:kinase-like domain-containing protein n=1 Tax=Cokeromyces recurvatus TaxID=90255 RepID=UPI00221FCB00|nr:kinase-like domain-containing protein [Cokeromyces recurvatus]KAI7904401.1 kinase-like domain-containing protein [Cokeromyces recurvatus]
MVPIIDKQDQRQQIFHHLLTEEETIRSHHQQEEVKDNPMILIEDEEDSTCGYIPLFEWPSSINDKHHFSLNTQLPTEEECKSKFSKMILAAYYQQHLLEQYPKEMHLIFDEQDRQIEGISILFQDNTREDYLELKVSLQYLAPELSISSVYHYEKVEVWSLGISLYQMLVGRYPFIEESLSHREVFNKMLICDYDLPKSLSKDARDLIQRMLSPEHTRASLDLIMFHPWLKSYIPWLNTEEEHKTKKMNYNKSTKIKNSRLRAKKKIKKTVHAVKKIITYIFKGPYPPPSSYHNIVIS